MTEERAPDHVRTMTFPWHPGRQATSDQPEHEPLEQMLADGAWLQGSTQPDGRLALRIGFPKRLGYPDNPNAAVPLMVMPPQAMLSGGQG
jgi:hypothetical protein